MDSKNISNEFFVRIKDGISGGKRLFDTVLVAPIENELKSSFFVDEFLGYFRNDKGIINLPMAEWVSEMDIKRCGVNLVEIDCDTTLRVRKWLKDWVLGD